MEKPLVNIICLSYNHSRFIARTIESIMAQKTSFDFVLIIHDDASTDGTPKIIEEYVSKYPNKIEVIYQQENKYSKNIDFVGEYVLPLVNGKYVALCEGDDYWVDPLKLQKQFDYMESHPGCSFCFTNAVVEDVQTGKQRPFIPFLKKDLQYVKENGDYSFVELARLSFIPTCSFFYPSENYKKYPNAYSKRYFGGDRKNSLFAASLGYAHYISSITCCYSYRVSNSAMNVRRRKIDIATIEKSYLELYDDLDAFTSFKYSEELSMVKLRHLKNVYYLQGKNKLLTDKDVELLKKNISFLDRLKRFIFMLMPNWLFDELRRLRKKIGV